MLVRSLLRPALALAAGAWLAGCSIYADDGSDPAESTPADPTAIGQCLRDTIAECYLEQLPADDCAALVESRCDLGGGPTDPDCHDQYLHACIASGADPMECQQRADMVCGGPGDPPGPDPDCFDQYLHACIASGADPMECAQRAAMLCGDPTMPPPGPDPMCHDQVLHECLAAGGDPMQCEERATLACGGGPGDPPPPPPPGDCFDTVYQECVQAGGDPMLCVERADQACYGNPGMP